MCKIHTWIEPATLTLISPWHIFWRWHWCKAQSTWNVIHFFSSDVKNGRVDTRSYRLCFTYSRITRATFSVTWTRWKGKQFTAFDKLFWIISTRWACVSSGKLGSCLTNTLITIRPSSERTLATLKNLVLPILFEKSTTTIQHINFNKELEFKKKSTNSKLTLTHTVNQIRMSPSNNVRRDRFVRELSLPYYPFSLIFNVKPRKWRKNNNLVYDALAFSYTKRKNTNTLKSQMGCFDFDWFSLFCVLFKTNKNNDVFLSTMI